MMMKMTPVVSSNIVSIGYNKEEKSLYVQFKRGLYEYLRVPESKYKAMLAAESVTGYLNSQIKDKYAFIKKG
jgi:hypothetical protein